MGPHVDRERAAPLRRVERARRPTSSIPRRRRCPGPSTWVTSSATPRPTSSRVSSGCGGRTSSTRWGGTTTACPPSGGCRTTIHVRCEPGVPYEPDFGRRWRTSRRASCRLGSISRANFIELCLELTAEDEKAFKGLWQRLGLSVDWALEYSTISAHSRRMAQWSFLDLHRRGHVYQVEAPTLWDVDFRTAVAQAEVEDRPKQGAFHNVRFGVEGGGLVRHRHHAPRAASGLRGGGRPPRRRAVQGAVRQAGGHPAVPRAGADLRQHSRGPGEGHRHPDGLHLR